MVGDHLMTKTTVTVCNELAHSCPLKLLFQRLRTGVQPLACNCCLQSIFGALIIISWTQFAVRLLLHGVKLAIILTDQL